MEFAELHCITNYSFLRGASHPEELVTRAAQLNYQALAITDECSMAGVVKAFKTKRDLELTELKLIYGSEFKLDDQLIVLLAKNKTGYTQLCHLITNTRRRAEKGSYRIFLDDFDEKLSQCLCLWKPAQLKNDIATLRHLKKQFPKRLWLLVENLLSDRDYDFVHYCTQLAKQHCIKAVCGNNVHMHTPHRKLLQDALTAIDHNCSIQDALPFVFPNSENHLRSLKKLSSIYSEKLITETMVIADQCQFELGEIQYQYPKDVLPGQYNAAEYLRILTYRGARRRFPSGIPNKVMNQIEKELTIIGEMSYEHYFLTIYDIVKFAKDQGILCQGRGSAANSTVCYCLHITEVNPMEVNLLFERFISSARSNEPPDIDVDFEHRRREEVIQYIYKKYGRKRSALAATVITYKRKSALRDIGKVLGIDANQLDTVIAKYGWRYRSKNWIDEIISDGVGVSQHQLALLKSLISDILGFPRHLSQHVGGFVITEGRVADLVPIENATMEDRTVIQWDKDDLETMCLMKMDVLGLGMLSAVQKAFTLIEQQTGKPMRIQDIPREDANVFEMIQKADTIGVFQIESRAQMSMLPRLKPKTYYDLVVQIAIVRPGPIHGDMVHPYLRRRTGKEPINYPRAELKDVLERTYGVPIFQEQIIKLAMVAANFTADEADTLRRSMASWKKQGHMSHLRGKLTHNMMENGYEEQFINQINRQIEGFGEYGFPESHAASFALIAYVSSWLKHYHPAEFCCALMNSQPMGFYTNSQLIQDVKRHGVTVLPVHINLSKWDHSIEHYKNKPTVRLGFRIVRQLQKSSAEIIINLRPKTGYQNLKELEELPNIQQSDLEALASANAFEDISGSRRVTRWETAALKLQSPLLMNAFESQEPIKLPEANELENFVEDQMSMGVSLGLHPIQVLRDQGVIPEHAVTAAELPEIPHQSLITVAGFIVNRQAPKSKALVTFVTLEDHTGNINIIFWLNMAQKYMKTLTTEQLVQVTGVLERDEEDGNVAHLIAKKMEPIKADLDDDLIPSRNYH